MAKVLYIKANAKAQGESRTFQVSDKFIESYRFSHPGDEVITLDLQYENIKFLTAEDIKVVFGEKTEESKRHPILKHAYQFAEADKYVLAEPLWNLSIPAILKAYIDYITVTGITFKYTESGPVGLLVDKKAINIVARGGDYSSEPSRSFEMGDRYLRTIMRFFGVADYTTLAIEALDTGVDVKTIVDAAILKATDLAKSF